MPAAGATACPTTLDVGVDLDGVLYPLARVVRQWALRTSGRPAAQLPLPTTWAFWRDEWGLSDREYGDLFSAGVRGGFIFRHGAPEAGGVHALQRIRAAGHRVHVVTARVIAGAEDEAATSTHAWLARWQIPHDSVVIVEDKRTVQLDCLLEDSVANYDAVASAGGTPFLYDRPWNEGHGGRRVHGWDEFAEAVRVLAAQRQSSMHDNSGA